MCEYVCCVVFHIDWLNEWMSNERNTHTNNERHGLKVSKFICAFIVSGIYYTMTIIGPAVGYVVGGQLLLIYTDFLTVDPLSWVYPSWNTVFINIKLQVKVHRHFNCRISSTWSERGRGASEKWKYASLRANMQILPTKNWLPHQVHAYRKKTFIEQNYSSCRRTSKFFHWRGLLLASFFFVTTTVGVCLPFSPHTFFNATATLYDGYLLVQPTKTNENIIFFIRMQYTRTQRVCDEYR